MTGPPDTMQAWRVHALGAPGDVLVREEVAVPEPGPGSSWCGPRGSPST